jgi:hypothetical protein
MISCLRACDQKFFLEFCRGLRPPGLSIDLHAGGCFATGLEAVYRGIWLHNLPFHDALMRANAAFLTAWGGFEIPEWKVTAKTRDRVWDAVESYFAEYPPQTDSVQPYFAADGTPTFEYTFAIPLEPTGPEIDLRCFPEHPNGGPFVYCGKFDMLGQRGGYPCVRDEKTTGSSIGVNWARQWQLRNQFMGYKWACLQCGIPVREVVIRGIAIQKTQIVHAESVQDYPTGLLERWYAQLRRTMWRIRRCYDEGYWDYNFAESCTAYGTCVFLDACTSSNPEGWLSQFEVRRWSPLDRNPAPSDPATSRAL